METKLNHSDLTVIFARQTALSSAKAEAFTKTFFDTIIEGLKSDGAVKINRLGTFKVTDVAARGSVNVNTGEKTEIRGHKKLVFLPAEALKEVVNQPFAMFEPVEIDDDYVDDDGIDADVSIDENYGGATEITEITDASVCEPVETDDDNVDDDGMTADASTDESSVEKNIYPISQPVEERQSVDDGNEKNRPILLYTFLITASMAVLFLVLFLPAILNRPTQTKADSVATQKTVNATTAATTAAPSIAEPDTVVVEQPAKPKPYTFIMVEELAAKSVASVGAGDTLLYFADGVIATHTVAENETLTRIALKYFGDKKLWPYIMQYNSLRNPNELCRGMQLLIPRLQPVGKEE